MSTTVYRSEQRVSYGTEAPTAYFGWYLSSTSDVMAVHPFASERERDAFVEKVAAAMPGEEDRWRIEDASAFLAFGHFGDHESDREWGYNCLLNYHGQELHDALLEQVEKWDEERTAHLSCETPEKGELVPLTERVEALGDAEREWLADALDDAVHELKGKEAADINNRGLEAQIAYIGEAQAREVLDDIQERPPQTETPREAPAAGMALLAQSLPAKASPAPER